MCFQSAKQKIVKFGQSIWRGIGATPTELRADKTAPLLPKINGWQLFLVQSGYEHTQKIAALRKQYSDLDTTPKMVGAGRIWIVLGTSLLVVIFWFVAVDKGWVANGGTSLISLWQLAITSPILFVLWAFRDKNRLYDLRNSRKDINLKEFQKLQQWATGNIPNPDAEDASAGIALQISALHALRPYLKGTFGDDFCRGAFEIYASTLRTQHQKISRQLKEKSLSPTFDNIQTTIKASGLTTQLNRIVSEEWFDFLINHDFPTASLSLMGVDLQGRYLQHRQFGQAVNLSSANLQGTNLKGTNLQGASLVDANLQGANLEGAKLQGAFLWNTSFQGASLEDAKLQGAFLWNANFQGARLEGANFQGVSLVDAKLQGASLGGANLQGASLVDANLQGANLEDASLQGANLKGSNLQGAFLWNANLQGSNLREANFQGAVSATRDVDYSYPVDGAGFYKRLNEKVSKETDLKGLSIEMMTAEALQNLKEVLSNYNEEEAEVVINRISASTEPYTLAETTKTGSYTQAEADQWIAEYKKAISF